MASLAVVGAAVLGAVYAIDEGADVVRGLQKVASVVKKAPPRAVEVLGRLAGRQFGGALPAIGERVAKWLPASRGGTFVRGTTQGQLLKAGLSKPVARAATERALKHAEPAKVRKVATKVDELEELAPVKQEEVIVELAKHDEGVKLADELNARVLDAATQTGKLEEAVTIATSVDEGAKTVNKLEHGQVLTVFKADETVKLVEELNAKPLKVAIESGKFDEVVDIVTSTSRRSDGVRLVNTLAAGGKLQKFLKFTVKKSDDLPADLERGVRLRIADAFSNGKLSADAVDGVIDSIKTLEADSRVYRLANVLADDIYATSNWYNVRGALYEIHTTDKYLIDLLKPGDELYMGYKPTLADDIDFDSLTPSQIDDISNKIGIPKSDVEEYLRYGEDANPSPEFDGLRFIKVGDDIVYYEAKSGEIYLEDLERKMSFILGYAKLIGAADTNFVVVSRLPSSSSKVRNNALTLLEDTDWARFKRVKWNYKPG